MLRVEMHNSFNELIIQLEGRLTEDVADYVRTLVTRCHTEGRLVVDLSEVTFIDAAGEEVLSFLKRFGAKFVADTAYTLDFCERLHLSLARKRVLKTRVSRVHADKMMTLDGDSRSPRSSRTQSGH